jgi:3-deoxy-D-manno-octulosonate 8-phosphate phosphatase (KDO 8-P phosphatase)
MTTDALIRARRVRLLTCDVDGVLTDGRIYVDDDGRETKAFSALDGVGINLLQRGSPAVPLRRSCIAPGA